MLRRKRASQGKMWPEKQIQLTTAGREPEREFLPEGILLPPSKAYYPCSFINCTSQKARGLLTA